MLICDEEPSPVSSDEVFFICEEQATNIKCDDKKSETDSHDKVRIQCYSSKKIQGKYKNYSLKAESTEELKQKQKKCGGIFSRKKQKKLFRDVGSGPCDEIKGNSKKDRDVNEPAHTILVKIQVENRSPCPDRSITLFSNEVDALNDKEIQCKLEDNKTVAVQVNFNSNESVVDPQCLKINKVRCCNKPSRILSTTAANKGKLCNQDEKVDTNELLNAVTTSPQTPGSVSPSANSAKMFLWSGKSFKNQSVIGSSCIEKSKKLPDKSYSVDRASLKKKKNMQGVSPVKKFNRSSLQIGQDKITINLSKYSPCASRLAASSKILNTSPTNLSPDSPLHVSRPRSPARIEENNQSPNLNICDKTSRKLLETPVEKMPLQASLSLNIDQLKRPNSTPRSRSVGDSCVTSPTSEATTTTLSYSPTGTEILSLEEVGQQNSTNTDISLSTPNLRITNNDRLVAFPPTNSPPKVNLETKC